MRGRAEPVELEELSCGGLDFGGKTTPHVELLKTIGSFLFHDVTSQTERPAVGYSRARRDPRAEGDHDPPEGRH